MARRQVVIARATTEFRLRAVAEIGLHVHCRQAVKKKGIRKIMTYRARSVLAGVVVAGLVVVGLALSALIATGGSAFARAGAYLYDLVKTEPYRSAWTKMLAKERDVPSWIKDFSVTGQGVNTPAHMVPVGVRAFTMATLCKPHDCGDNMLYVMFAPDGSAAYAKLVEAGKPPRFFGKPDAAVQAAMTGAEGQ
jgi:hypothetical protein